MTESEAIMIIENERPSCGEKIKFTEEEKYEAYSMAIQALEKQMPMKPIMKQYFKDMEEKYLCCPTCGEILTDRIPGDNKTFCFHCMNCGQKLDWSDENEID